MWQIVAPPGIALSANNQAIASFSRLLAINRTIRPPLFNQGFKAALFITKLLWPLSTNWDFALHGCCLGNQF
jgi:hypothetical protein